MASSFKSPILQAIDQNGNPVPGAKLFVYQTGTTTPVVIYSNQSLTTPLPNPLIANARGYFASAGGIVQNIWWDGLPLRLRLTDVDENVIWEIDDYSAASGADPAANINVTGIWAGANAKSLAALKARSVAGLTGGEGIMLIDGGRSGAFVWRAGNQSANVTVASRDAIWVVPDSLASDGSQGAWERVWSGEVNVRWWGPTGTAINSTTIDDSPGFNNCFGFALEQASHPGIIIPNGNYTLRKPIVIENTSDTARRNLVVRGFGGEQVDGGTIIHYRPANPSTDTEERAGLIQLWSAYGMRFQSICFRNRLAGVESILFIGSKATPNFSGLGVIFDSCGFLPSPNAPSTEADVVVTNNKMAAFVNCTFNNVSLKNVRLGGDAADHPGSFQQGRSVATKFEECFFFRGFDVRHASNWSVKGSTFGNNEEARIYSTGQQRMMAGEISYNIFAIEQRTGYAAITQGNGAPTANIYGAGGLVIRGNAFRDYQTCVDITKGNVRLEGNQYALRTGTVTATINGVTPGAVTRVTTAAAHNLDNQDRITIAGVVGSAGMETLLNAAHRVLVVDATTLDLIGVDSIGETYTSGGTITREKEIGIRIRPSARNVSIDTSEDFDVVFSARNIPVLDERTGPQDEIVSRAALAADATLPGIGSFQTALQQQTDRKLRGGQYRVTFSACLLGSADSAGGVRARMSIAGVVTTNIRDRIENNGDLVISWSGTVSLPATTSVNPPNATLQIWQENGSSALTVRGSANSRTTFEIAEL